MSLCPESNSDLWLNELCTGMPVIDPEFNPVSPFSFSFGLGLLNI